MHRHLPAMAHVNADFRQHNHDGDGTDNHRSALRNSVSRVRVRALGSGRPEYPKPAGFLSNWRAPSSQPREEKNECDTDQDIYGFLPRTFCSQFQKSNNPHALNSSITARRLSEYALFSVPPKAIHSAVLQLRIISLSMWREGDGFRQQRENIPETNAAIPIIARLRTLHPS